MPSSSSSSQQQPSRAELSAALDGVEQAGPIASMPTWDAAELAQLPASVQPLFMDPNLRTGSDFETPNKPPNMRSDVSVQLSLTPNPPSHADAWCWCWWCNRHRGSARCGGGAQQRACECVDEG